MFLRAISQGGPHEAEGSVVPKFVAGLKAIDPIATGGLTPAHHYLRHPYDRSQRTPLLVESTGTLAR